MDVDEDHSLRHVIRCMLCGRKIGYDTEPDMNIDTCFDCEDTGHGWT